MATFQEIVNEFDNMRTPRENDQKGKRWEVLCKWYFRNSSIQKNNVKNVWKNFFPGFCPGPGGSFWL